MRSVEVCDTAKLPMLNTFHILFTDIWREIQCGIDFGSLDHLMEKSGVGVIDDKMQGYTVMNDVSYFFLPLLVFFLRICIFK